MTFGALMSNYFDFDSFIKIYWFGLILSVLIDRKAWQPILMLVILGILNKPMNIIIDVINSIFF